MKKIIANKNFIIITFVILIILTVLFLFYSSVTSSSDNDITAHSDITVHSIDELNNALRSVSSDIPVTVTLAPGQYVLKEKQIPIIVPSNVTVSGYGAVLETDYEKPIFLIGNPSGKNDENSFLINDITDFALTTDFIIKVDNPGLFKPGMAVYLQDNLFGEFNIIKEVVEDAVILTQRPVNSYSVEQEARIYPRAPTTDAGIFGFTFYIAPRDLNPDTNPLSPSDPELSIIVVCNSVSADIRDITVLNLNLNLNAISVMSSDLILISDVEINGGRIGVLLTSHAQGVKVLNSRIIDASDGVRIGGGSRNIISGNTISRSGQTIEWGDGICVLGGASYNTIDKNLIEGGNCYGVWFLVDENARGNIITNNIINANITFGLQLVNGSGYIISGNRFMRNSGGISIESKVASAVINGNYIADNNTVGLIMDEPNDDIVIRDNIILDNGVGIDPDVIGYAGNIVLLSEVFGHESDDIENAVDETETESEET